MLAVQCVLIIDFLHIILRIHDTSNSSSDLKITVSCYLRTVKGIPKLKLNVGYKSVKYQKIFSFDQKY